MLDKDALGENDLGKTRKKELGTYAHQRLCAKVMQAIQELNIQAKDVDNPDGLFQNQDKLIGIPEMVQIFAEQQGIMYAVVTCVARLPHPRKHVILTPPVALQPGDNVGYLEGLAVIGEVARPIACCEC